ncbi:MAG TPA: right-handed parallel beta-helix repeat-containing protein, partial [Pirellulaceae bacterium]|nr:right-handed parallel beta-helix repeat-containing protein [Pirellulaceae bacterium]
MIRNWQLIACGAIFILVVGAWQAFSIQSQPPAGSRTLPGARPTIEAAAYSTLQAAIDSLPSEGGVVRLPAGTFEISQPLLITQEDVLLEGSGTATHIRNMNADGQPAIVIQSPKIKEDPRAVLWRVQIANLRVTGNEKSGPGILARHINEVFLHGVTVSYHGGDGIQLDNCYEDPRICDCLLTYNKANGLNLVGCHDIVVVGNQFEENLDALRCTDSFNLCMTGNNLDDHLRDGVVIENTYGSVVSGNMIEECNGRAIVLNRDCYGITLSANVIAHNGGGIHLVDA